jgi:hypothetical protein
MNRVRMILAGAALAAIAIVGSPIATAGAQSAPPARDELPFYDLRSTEAPVAAAAPVGVRSARVELRSVLGDGARFDVDPVTGTARSIERLGGTLTRPAAGDRREIAEAWIRGHLDAIGLTADDLGTLATPERTVAPGGVLYLRWSQNAHGIPLFEGELRAIVTADGRVLSVGGAPVSGLADALTVPAIDSAEALRIARRDAGVDAAPVRASEPVGPQRTATFDRGDDAHLTLYQSPDGVRLAWDLTVHAGAEATYSTLVDAGSGALLYRQNLVKHVAQALAWERYPGATAGGTAASVDLEARGWLPSGASALNGAYAHAWSDANGDERVTAGEEVAPSGGSFAFPFQDLTGQAANGACDAAHPCSWNHDVPTSWRANRAQTATQAFYYANRFHDHLAAAPIGFDSASGNFENVDKVLVLSDAGAGTAADGGPGSSYLNNASMETPRDGASPVMDLYLFRASTAFRDVSGGDDAAVVYHEYTHGLSNRLITLPNGNGALGGQQPGAMGEGWSDWYAADLLAADGLLPDTAAVGDVDPLGYVDPTHKIRSQPLDCPVGGTAPACPGSTRAGAGGYTYGDFGRVASSYEVHADGEIWGETLWDMRRELGSDMSESLITGGMRGSSPQPTFLQERDAILQADVALYGGHHQAALWRVFSRRGMGTNASTTGYSDTRPQEGFAAPPDQQPTGSLAATPSAASPGETVRFDAGSFTDADGRVVEYRWDFDGDGSVDRTTATPTADHAYATGGRFPAGVTAVDDGGTTGSASATVQVGPGGPYDGPGGPADGPGGPNDGPGGPNDGPNDGPAAHPRAPLVGRPAARRGTVTVAITCDSRCTVAASLTIDRRTAARLRLRLRRTSIAGSLHTSLVAGTQKVSIKLNAKVARALRRAARKRLPARLALSVRDAEGQVANPTLTVSLRG